MQAVILAGGNGVRLHPHTAILPKPLLPIHDMPIIEIILRQLRHHGFTRVSIALGYLAELIQIFLGDGSKYGLQIDYSVETTPLGTISPLTLIDDLEPTILVMNADLLTNLDFRTLMNYHRAHHATVTIGMFHERLKTDFGVLELDGNNCLRRYVEKPELGICVSMGIYVLESRAVQRLSPTQPTELPEFINALINDGEKVVGYPFSGYWLDIGRHSDLDRALNDFDKIRAELNID